MSRHTPAMVTLTIVTAISTSIVLGQPNTTGKEEASPGKDKTTKTKLLEAGAEIMQSEGPINAISKCLRLSFL